MRRIPGVRSPILAALSGYGQEEDQRRARDTGFDQHFTKPVDPLILQEFLERASWEDRGD